MKGNTIKSNKWGKGIHSPFVYRLVTEIIFSRYPFYAFDEIKKISASKQEKEELEVLFRLLNFFQPKQIKVYGEQDLKIEQICKVVLPDVEVSELFCVKKTQEIMFNPLEGNTFIIWNNYCNNENFNFEGNEPIIIVFRKLKDLQMKKMVEYFQDKKEISVCIEFQTFGIAIVNSKFQKQNYVINH